MRMLIDFYKICILHKMCYFKGYDSDRPLTAFTVEKLIDNRMLLVNCIDIELTSLDEALVVDKCITPRHREVIQTKSGKSGKNEELCNIMERRSIPQYQIFLQCLRDTRQEWIALILETNDGSEQAFVHNI